MKGILDLRTVTIYTVSHPITGMIFYVGRTTTPLQKRLGAMLTTKEIYNNNLSEILNSLKEEGLKPVIDDIDKCSYENRMAVEEFWIQLITTWGFELTNVKHKKNPCHKRYVVKYPKDRSPVKFSFIEKEIISLVLSSSEIKELAIENDLSSEIFRIHLKSETVPKWVKDMILKRANEKINLIINKYNEYTNNDGPAIC